MEETQAVAAPADVEGRDVAPFLVRDEDGLAVGGLDDQADAGFVRGKAVPFGKGGRLHEPLQRRGRGIENERIAVDLIELGDFGNLKRCGEIQPVGRDAQGIVPYRIGDVPASIGPFRNAPVAGLEGAADARDAGKGEGDEAQSHMSSFSVA